MGRKVGGEVGKRGKGEDGGKNREGKKRKEGRKEGNKTKDGRVKKGIEEIKEEWREKGIEWRKQKRKRKRNN